MRDKDKSTAAALSILLGSFGAHRFYLEQNGLGLVYLLFCWTLVPTVLGVAEGVRFIRMSEEDFYRRYEAPSLPGPLDPADRPVVPYVRPSVNVVVNNAPTAPTEDAATRIERLHALLEKGALTPEEFEAQKARILAE